MREKCRVGMLQALLSSYRKQKIVRFGELAVEVLLLPHNTSVKWGYAHVPCVTAFIPAPCPETKLLQTGGTMLCQV